LLAGLFFLIAPTLFIELGKSKDIIKGGLIILLGIFLIIKHSIFNFSLILILLLNFLILIYFGIEIFIYRWMQLSDKEKNQILNITQLLNKISLLTDAIKLGLKKVLVNLKFKNISSNDKNAKKWVRPNNDGDNQTFNSEILNNSNQIKSAKNTKKDIIVENKN